MHAKGETSGAEDGTPRKRCMEKSKNGDEKVPKIGGKQIHRTPESLEFGPLTNGKH